MMDAKAWELLMDTVKGTKADTEKIRKDQEDFRIRFLKHDNRINDLEKNTVTRKDFNDEVQPLKRAEKARKGFWAWTKYCLTIIGLGWIALQIERWF